MECDTIQMVVHSSSSCGKKTLLVKIVVQGKLLKHVTKDIKTTTTKKLKKKSSPPLTYAAASLIKRESEIASYGLIWPLTQPPLITT